MPDAELSDAQRRETAALMRINHVGEVCAQALYEGQRLVAREPRVRDLLSGRRGRRPITCPGPSTGWKKSGGDDSILEPLFYAGSFTLGAAAGLIGDRWNLGFLAETERQVEQHLDGHLERLPEADARSRAILGSAESR